MPPPEPFIIHRFAEHHVNFGDNTWQVEHPITCVLQECDIPDRVFQQLEDWGRPNSTGWELLREDAVGDLQLWPAKERVAYEVRRITT